MDPTPEDIADATCEPPTRRKGPESPRRDPYLPEIHRLLPSSPQAEMGILSSFLLCPIEIGAFCIERGITPDWMHLPAHATLLRALLEMWQTSRPIDFITVTQFLRDLGKLDEAGGAAYVTELFTYLPTAANAGYYLEICQEKIVLREIIRVCTEHAASAYDYQDDVAGLLESLEKKVLAIRRSDEATIRESNTKDATMRAIGVIEQMYEQRGSFNGMPTGFAKLDQMLGGLHPQELTIIAGRPSMGKTAISINIAEHIALFEGRAVVFFSCEMSEGQLFQRLLCSRARVNIVAMRHGYLADRDFPALTAAASKIAESQLIVCEAIGATYGSICAKARRLHQRYNLAAVFIDYAQLVRSTSKQAQGSREREIAEVSAGFKNLAHELKLPVVLLAQLGRDVEKRNHRGGRVGWPRLSDLRESGALEQDADNVLFLHREEKYAETDEEMRECEGKATVIVAKQRNGDTGDIPLTFIKEFCRFENRAEEIEEIENPQLPMEDPHASRRKSE